MSVKLYTQYTFKVGPSNRNSDYAKVISVIVPEEDGYLGGVRKAIQHGAWSSTETWFLGAKDILVGENALAREHGNELPEKIHH